MQAIQANQQMQQAPIENGNEGIMDDFMLMLWKRWIPQPNHHICLFRIILDMLEPAVETHPPVIESREKLHHQALWELAPERII